jgi:hypothetical protein
MQTELISIPTPTHPLDGAYYTSDGSIKGAAMYCHGNQMNFYVCAASFLAPHITSLGYVSCRSTAVVTILSARTTVVNVSAAPIKRSLRESKKMI